MKKTGGSRLWVANVSFLLHIWVALRRQALLLTLIVGLLLAKGVAVSAYVTGPCSDCHTMHYSQGGEALSVWGSAGPYDALLTVDCIGCHTGDNSAGGKVPFVMPETPALISYGGATGTGTETGSTTLAGGSFYWVLSGHSFGHNVAGYCDPDSTMVNNSSVNLPPGYVSGWPAAGSGGTPAGGGSWDKNQQVTCAGTYGCHGSHVTTNQAQAIHGGHHALNGPAIISPEPSSADYRMLFGIAGIEDSDWEFKPTVSQHNQYHGVDGSGSVDRSTISYLCSQCHGRFHFNDDVSAPVESPWVRHPTNFDMSGASSSEYAKYNNGIGVGIYSLVAPVASDLSLSANQIIKENIFTTTDDAIVTCLSCHRAHGSPYYKSLRWNYAGSANGGSCAVCHTEKN